MTFFDLLSLRSQVTGRGSKMITLTLEDVPGISANAEEDEHMLHHMLQHLFDNCVTLQ